MGEPRRQPSQGGEVCRAPQGIAVLVQGAFDATQGGHGVPELHGHGRRSRRRRFERGNALAQDRQALTQEGVGGGGVSHASLPQQEQMVCTEAPRHAEPHRMTACAEGSVAYRGGLPNPPAVLSPRGASAAHALALAPSHGTTLALLEPPVNDHTTPLRAGGGPPVVNGQFLAVGYQWCRDRSSNCPECKALAGLSIRKDILCDGPKR